MTLAGVPLTFIYFFPAPMLFQSIIAALLPVGCIANTRHRLAPRPASDA